VSFFIRRKFYHANWPSQVLDLEGLLCNAMECSALHYTNKNLKTLRLPTFLREYDKVARQCSAESMDYPRYLLCMTELELLDRERRATERRIGHYTRLKSGEVMFQQEPESFNLLFLSSSA
jgi:hypothetical protein